MLRCVVLDFDGTLTDTEAEGEVFLPGYQEELARLMGREDLRQDWEEAAREILADPDHSGWRLDGRIVAPAQTDAYILASCVSHRLLDRAGLLLDQLERTQVLQPIFHAHYSRHPARFRPDARDFLRGLLRRDLAVFVVTNSAASVVEHRLAGLKLDASRPLPVLGGARKYLVTPSTPATVPETVEVAGLPRPIYLRRGAYARVLESLWTKTGAGPESTLVCGDLYELDLALPAALGCSVALVTRASTAAYERNAVVHHAQGSVHAGLLALGHHIDRLGS